MSCYKEACKLSICVKFKRHATVASTSCANVAFAYPRFREHKFFISKSFKNLFMYH